MIYKWSSTQFSLTFSESTGACALRIPSVISGNSLRDDFWVVRDSVFLDIFWVNRCCARWRIYWSPLETFSVMISERAPPLFFFIVSESTGVVRSEDSFYHLWKQLRDDFWVVSDSVFLDIFWVNRCCARWGFLLSSLETVYVTISEWSGTQFALMFSESTRAVHAEDSFCHLCKQFPWWFLSGQRLSFPWHFLSQLVLCALRIPSVISVNSFRGYLWLGGDSVFLDCLWVNRGCVRWRIHWSPLETFSVMISERVATLFFFIVFESTGVVRSEDSFYHLWKQFRDDFWVVSDSVFLDIFWVNWCCARWGFLLSSL